MAVHSTVRSIFLGKMLYCLQTHHHRQYGTSITAEIECSLPFKVESIRTRWVVKECQELSSQYCQQQRNCDGWGRAAACMHRRPSDATTRDFLMTVSELVPVVFAVHSLRSGGGASKYSSSSYSRTRTCDRHF